MSDEHKKLLKRMEFRYFPHGGDIVFIGTDGKRPFGNSSIHRDIAEILDWKLPNDDLSYEQDERASKLIEELPAVLNKIIADI